jgi:hypothetical protein
MAPLLETINSKLQAWMRTWEAVTFTPHKFFQPDRKPRAMSTFEFFVGNYLMAYLLLFSASALFFFLYYRPNLLYHSPAKEMAVNVGLATAIFAVFVVLSFISVFLSSTVMYSVAKMFHGTATLSQNVNALMHLSSIEPLAIGGLSMFLLSYSHRESKAFAVAGLLISGLARIWALVAGFHAVAYLQPLRRLETVLIYVLGFLPAYFILNIAILTSVSIFLTAVIIPQWD